MEITPRKMLCGKRGWLTATSEPSKVTCKLCKRALKRALKH